MKFGLAFATTGSSVRPEGLARAAVAAEELGFESIWSTEHVIVPIAYDSVYPYNDTGRIPGPADTDMPDPLIPLAYAAALTSKIKLGTAAVILPEHHPLILGKSVAHLDVLSGGRVILGVGVGWLREEYDAVGVDFTTRGRRMDAAIDALRDIWSDGPTTFDSEFFSWPAVESNPKPAQAGGVPIHITGHSPAAARRTARVGDGFVPGIATPDDFAAVVALVREECARIGRDAGGIELTAGCNGITYSADDVRRLEDHGATRVHAAFWAPDTDALIAQMTEYAETVMAAVGTD